jgi:molybdopterin converting factor small subunit
MVEFYGVPRLRAGRSELVVQAETVRDVLGALERECPGLGRMVLENDRLSPQYLLSLDGGIFIRDLRKAVQAGDRLLLLSADGGG